MKFGDLLALLERDDALSFILQNTFSELFTEELAKAKTAERRRELGEKPGRFFEGIGFEKDAYISWEQTFLRHLFEPLVQFAVFKKEDLTKNNTHHTEADLVESFYENTFRVQQDLNLIKAHLDSEYFQGRAVRVRNLVYHLSMFFDQLADEGLQYGLDETPIYKSVFVWLDKVKEEFNDLALELRANDFVEHLPLQSIRNLHLRDICRSQKSHERVIEQAIQKKEITEDLTVPANRNLKGIVWLILQAEEDGLLKRTKEFEVDASVIAHVIRNTFQQEISKRTVYEYKKQFATRKVTKEKKTAKHEV